MKLNCPNCGTQMYLMKGRYRCPNCDLKEDLDEEKNGVERSYVG